MQSSSHSDGIHAFIALHLFGAASFLAIILLEEVFHRDNIPYPAWRSFCVAWVVFGCSYSLLTLAGIQFSPDPDHFLCTFQTGLIYAAPPLMGNATLALIIQLRSAILYGMGKLDRPVSRTTEVVIAIAPWTVWVMNTAGIVVYTSLNPSHIGLNKVGTYCHLFSTTVSKVIGLWLVVVGSIAVGFEISLIFPMYREGFKQVAGRCNASRTNIRLGIFMLQLIVAIGIAIRFVVAGGDSLTLDILISIQPTVAAIVFGARKRLLCTWYRRNT